MRLFTLLTFICFLLTKNVEGQRTVLDEEFGKVYRHLRLIGLEFVGRSGENPDNLRFIRRNNKAQRSFSRSEQFFCDPKGPGRRSKTPPTSVHTLRPGDVDIIGGIGDSLTAGNGIFASNLLQVTVENKGVAFTIGGKGNWRQFLTLPNILKEFNPNLYGYSLTDGLSTDRSSRFNVAELGAMSRDVSHEAKVLYNRLKSDPMVNMTHHWKLITILIGSNDFCSDMCYYPNPKKILDWHEQNMLKTLRFLRDNVPRLMVNIISSPNLRFLTKYIDPPALCQSTLKFECPCLIGKSQKILDYYESIMVDWGKVDTKVAFRDEFNSETFTVNVYPFAQFEEMIKKPNGSTDFQFLSTDCFHLSQKGHASCANAIWNNMLEVNKTTHLWLEPFKNIKCPTIDRPYIITRSNSGLKLP